jgi:REP element-mobilizing transposase RayT
MAGPYTKLYYHIVFSTKNRGPFITSVIEDELHKYISGIIRGIGGVCVEINGMSDHIHILAILPPKIAVSDALREIKANSSKWIHETKPDLAKFGWQDGYAAFTVSKVARGFRSPIHSRSKEPPCRTGIQGRAPRIAGQARDRVRRAVSLELMPPLNQPRSGARRVLDRRAAVNAYRPRPRSAARRPANHGDRVFERLPFDEQHLMHDALGVG